jgi:DNA-binding transcriptional LysR family regulator
VFTTFSKLIAIIFWNSGALRIQASPKAVIELRHLRYFIAVAEGLNFRRAAERVHIGTTPLSRTNRDLGDLRSVLLFVSAPQKLHLTPVGLCLLQEARKVFICIKRAYRAVRDADVRFRPALRRHGRWARRRGPPSDAMPR